MGPNTPIPSLPTQPQLETTDNLPALVLTHYRASFHSALARGEAKYFVIPYTLLGSTIIPIIYLIIPHRNRPWLYQARWAVAALVVSLNFDLLRNGTSSANMAIAYVTGLVASWGTIWWLTILLVLEPQFEAARVQRRRRKGKLDCGDEEGSAAIDESVAAVQDEYEHYWQYYPSDGSLFERLGWIFDLMGSLRGVGWNFATSTTPHPPPPSTQSPNLVNLHQTPISTPTGTTRPKTYRHFTFTRLSTVLTSLLILDLCTLLARKDPYFTLGPSYPPSTLPQFLSSLHPQLLSLLRSLTSLAALLSGLQFYLNFSQLITCLFGISPLWQHPTPFGSFTTNVLDRGLAGFWGGFWHQTFRVGFTAPMVFLSRRGYFRDSINVKRVLALLTAFTLSGCIHAAGGYTSIPPSTNIYAPFLFFGLSFVGIVVQSMFCEYLFRGRIQSLPGWVRRMGNGGFVFLWLHATRWILLDDMCVAGLFLFEPVPFSPLRLLGLVEPLKGDENWWRWDGEYLAKWVWGVDGRWWESGWRV